MFASVTLCYVPFSLCNGSESVSLGTCRSSIGELLVEVQMSLGMVCHSCPQCLLCYKAFLDPAFVCVCGSCLCTVIAQRRPLGKSP